jgi:hypothetical protein
MRPRTQRSCQKRGRAHFRRSDATHPTKHSRSREYLSVRRVRQTFAVATSQSSHPDTRKEFSFYQKRMCDTAVARRISEFEIRKTVNSHRNHHRARLFLPSSKCVNYLAHCEDLHSPTSQTCLPFAQFNTKSTWLCMVVIVA